jgi:outer membrane biosynthesis protein TonB
MRVLTLATFLAAASATVPALAAPSPTDRAIARQHYEKAVTHFNLGEFADAAAEFREVYKVAPQPVLLYDAAQAYRLANDRAQALVLYQSFLHLAPTTPHKAEVTARIQELQASATTPTAPATPSTPATKETAPDGKPEATTTTTVANETTPLASTKGQHGNGPTSTPDAPPAVAKPSTKESEPDGKPADKHGDAVAAAGGSERLKPVVEIIRKNRAGFRACFDTWSAAHPGIDGAVTLSFYLAPDGNVDRADADAKGKNFTAPDVETCIEDFARSLKYPASSNGKFTRFNYPFDFKAAR